MKINFYLSVLLEAGPDQDIREIRSKEENELMRKAHLHEYIFKAVSIRILSIARFRNQPP